MEQQHNYSRRTFLQALLGAPLALGAAVLAPEDAEAATKVIRAGNTYLYVPAIWKSRLEGTLWEFAAGLGMNPGGDTTNNYALNHKGTRVEVLCVSYDSFKWPSGKLKRSYKGSLRWKFRRGEAVSEVNAYNVPLIIWESVHGQNSYSITKKQAKELLKISTGGRIKYATLVKWSKAKAKSKGAKAVRAWVGAKVVKKIKIR